MSAALIAVAVTSEVPASKSLRRLNTPLSADFAVASNPTSSVCRAISGLLPRYLASHSITSSAIASSVSGTERPSAFAVLRVDNELEFGRLDDGQIGRLFAFEN